MVKHCKCSFPKKLLLIQGLKQHASFSYEFTGEHISSSSANKYTQENIIAQWSVSEAMIYLHRSEWGHSAIFDTIIIIPDNFSSSLGSLFFKEVHGDRCLLGIPS
jgi:hypothetical protein